MIPKFKLLWLLLAFVSVSFYAQNRNTVSGIVKSNADDTPLAGVSVIVKNTLRGTDTDFDGNFTIYLELGDVLVFTYLGFKKEEYAYEGEGNIEIYLQEDIDGGFDEIVLIGYGTANKSQITGSVTKVSNDNLYQLPYSRVDEALLGQASGVNVQATENQAGSEPTMTIRGFGSISADSRPAVVIDGIVVDYDFLANLDINDIDSFEILKDASSAAIYGSEGSNGVIMITTKSGKSGETKFNYNTYIGFKEARRSDAYYFSIKDFAKKEMEETGSLSNLTAYKLSFDNDKDWQDIIFDGGLIESHSFSASGGNEDIKFSTSLKYLNDEGVVLTDSYKVYSGKLKLDFNLNEKIELGVNLIPSFSRKRIPGDDIYEATRQLPWLPLYHNENTIQFVNTDAFPNVQIGDYAVQGHFDNVADFDEDGDLDTVSNSSENNPGAKLLEREFHQNKFKLFSNVYGKYNFTDAFNFKSSFGFTYEDTEDIEWQGSLATGAANSAYYQNQRILNKRFVFDNFFTYQKTFGKNDINSVAGVTLQNRNSQFNQSIGTGFQNDLIKDLSGASSSTSTGYEIERNKVGMFARLSYAYDNKYLFSASFRRDGSSVFGSETKYGNFPAVSVGWNISNENFLMNSNFLSNFKLRFSYGITGNENFDTGNDLTSWYSYLALLQNSNAVIEGEIVNGISSANVANDLLQWEGSEEINPGVDFGFFNNIITGSFEWYKRTSNSLLVANPVSYTSGFSSAIENTGEVVNTGYELELTSNNFTNDNFGWRTKLIATTNKNELTDFGNANGTVSSISSSTPSEWINLEGNPISSFYGWVVDTEVPGEYLINQYGVVGGQSLNTYVKDLNGDGLIDEDDKAILGNPYPDLIWSLTNEFRIKNIDISFMFQGSHGAEVSNVGDNFFYHFFDGDLDINPATTPNQEFLRPKYLTNSVIQDASYIALRNVNLGYSIPEDFLAKYGLSKLRVYMVGQNLLYFTSSDYSGYNPEGVSSTSPTNYGSQIGGSPIFRTVSLGLNLGF